MFFYYNPILIAAAVLPAIALMVFVYREDRMEKEPWPLLLSLLAQGIISTSLAVFTERLGTKLLGGLLSPNTLIYQVIFNFLVVGLSEEGFKYLLLKRRTWLSPAFNCQFDGVVYAVFVSLGFALWENIDYVVMYGFSTALVRAVTAVPGHACFGVFMGAWYGLAKRYENYGYPEKSRRCRTLAVLLPTLLHGAYDLIATLEHSALSWGFAGFILALFVAALYAVKKLSREDRFIG